MEYDPNIENRYHVTVCLYINDTPVCQYFTHTISFDFVAQFVCQLYPSMLVPYSHGNTESIIFDLDFVVVFVLLIFICSV